MENITNFYTISASEDYNLKERLQFNTTIDESLESYNSLLTTGTFSSDIYQEIGNDSVLIHIIFIRCHQLKKCACSN